MRGGHPLRREDYGKAGEVVGHGLDGGLWWFNKGLLLERIEYPDDYDVIS